MGDGAWALLLILSMAFCWLVPGLFYELTKKDMSEKEQKLMRRKEDLKPEDFW